MPSKLTKLVRAVVRRTTKSKVLAKKTVKKTSTKKKTLTKKKAKPTVRKTTPKTTKKAIRKTTKKKVAKKASAKKKTAKKTITKKRAQTKTTKKAPIKKLTKKKTAAKKPVKKVAAKKTPTKKKAVKKVPTKTAKKVEKKKEEKKPRISIPKFIPKKQLETVTIADPAIQPWVPERSKIKAAIQNGLPESYLSVHRMLYIGAAHGYTISHIHDKPIELYAVEKSREMMQHFLPVAENLPSVVPIFRDAAMPESYAHLVPKKVDLVFQDIAQKDQTGIFLSNCERFLAAHGVGILCLKARNIDSTAEPNAVFAENRQRLEAGGATIVQEVSLEPYQEGHRLFVVHLNPYMDW